MALSLSPLQEYEDRIIYAVTIPLFFLSMCSVCIRVTSRLMQHGKLSLDDYLAIAGSLALVPQVVGGWYWMKDGLGTPWENLTKHQVERRAMWKLVNLFGYTFGITLTKLSILALLHRIFSTTSRVFPVIIWILAAMVILWAIGTFVDYGLECRPFIWNTRDSCGLPLTLAMSAYILNVVHDLLLFFLPQPTIWMSLLPLKDKLGISVIFFIGLVATVMCIMKLVYIQGVPQHLQGVYYQDYTISFISHLCEPILASICSNLPPMPFFFRKISGKILSFLSSIRSQTSQPSTDGGCGGLRGQPVSPEIHAPRRIYVKYRVSIGLQTWSRGQLTEEGDMV